jgi:hypothetical protein
VKLVSIGLSMLIACNSLIAQVGRVAYSFCIAELREYILIFVLVTVLVGTVSLSTE